MQSISVQIKFVFQQDSIINRGDYECEDYIQLYMVRFESCLKKIVLLHCI